MNELGLIRAPFDETPEPDTAQTARVRAALHAAMNENAGRQPRTRIRIVPRLLGGLAAAGLAAVVVALFLAAPPNRKTGPSANADTLASVLARLDAGAANDLPVRTLAAGEFWYHTDTTLETGSGKPTSKLVLKGRTVHVVTDQPLTIEAWFAADGTSRGRYMPMKGWKPASSADRAAWRQAGSPNLDAAVQAQETGPGLDTVVHTPPTAFPASNGGSADLADYAGDPVAMAEALRASLGSNRTAVDLFNKIGQLLYPMFGAPPEVRRALLRVLLTQVEGVRIASVTARDLSGRRGVLAELADGTATTGILFDPDLAEPLGQVTDSNDSRPRHTESDWSTPTIVPAIDQRPDGTRVPPRK